MNISKLFQKTFTVNKVDDVSTLFLSALSHYEYDKTTGLFTEKITGRKFVLIADLHLSPLDSFFEEV